MKCITLIRGKAGSGKSRVALLRALSQNWETTVYLAGEHELLDFANDHVLGETFKKAVEHGFVFQTVPKINSTKQLEHIISSYKQTCAAKNIYFDSCIVDSVDNGVSLPKIKELCKLYDVTIYITIQLNAFAEQDLCISTI